MNTAGHSPSAMNTAGDDPSAMDTAGHDPSAMDTAGHGLRASCCATSVRAQSSVCFENRCKVLAKLYTAVRCQLPWGGICPSNWSEVSNSTCVMHISTLFIEPVRSVAEHPFTNFKWHLKRHAVKKVMYNGWNVFEPNPKACKPRCSSPMPSNNHRVRCGWCFCTGHHEQECPLKSAATCTKCGSVGCMWPC